VGWIVERIENTNYFIRKFPLIGSVLKIQRPEKIDSVSMIRIIKKYKVFQIIIEPKDKNQVPKILKLGFNLSKSPYLPSKTLEIDLTKPKETIFRNFRKDARQAIRKGSGQTIKSYSTPDEIKIWRKAWKKSVSFNRYVPSVQQLINLRKSFPNNYSVFLASHNISGSIMGGALFTISSHERLNHTTYYWYAFTNKEGRASLSQYSLLWKGLLWAKSQGCKVFDFEGVYDPRFPNKSWLGFTHFKKSFGGTEVLYPGCYTKFRNPFL
jgi:lipid II:glycine glycyltransferase (peptidoglycan interpeptide bridge formation enzyme)